MGIEKLLTLVQIEEAEQITGIRNRAKEKTEKLERYYNALSSLGELGAKTLKEAEQWGTHNLFYTNIDITDIAQFHDIKKVFGALEKWTIEPVPRKHKKVRLTLKPKDKKFDGIYFRYVRKLNESDPCKVVTVTRSERQVVCSA